ncbi:hypothetical protein [Neorhizobium galegae]|uniref:hypothetical protein n=1 Tax=Neorhizobium galegae TaxID=399 RepID=UPI001F337313|nr:hypothetical protein [Neorhizobium galegae]UIK05024.1 hypothetical protein LZK81_20605 [Neorhizobium galegae]
MKRHSVNIYKIARECGVRLRDASEHSTASRRPGDCFCKPTIREIGDNHGEAHLRLVLMLLTGDRANARELYADMIKAVSRLLAQHPDLVRRPSLVDELNAIDLGSMRRAAKDLKSGVPTSDVLLVMLSLRLMVPAMGEIGEAA